MDAIISQMTALVLLSAVLVVLSLAVFFFRGLVINLYQGNHQRLMSMAKVMVIVAVVFLAIAALIYTGIIPQPPIR